MDYIANGKTPVDDLSHPAALQELPFRVGFAKDCLLSVPNKMGFLCKHSHPF